jgi:hypothetical protein
MKFILRNIILGTALLITGIQAATVEVAVDNLKYRAPSTTEIAQARLSQDATNTFTGLRAAYYYGIINTSGRFSYERPHTVNSAFWELLEIRQPQGLIDTFKIKPECRSPSAALIDLFNGGGAVECAFIRSLVEVLIILDLIGPERFDVAFDSNLRIPEIISTLRETARGIPQEIGKFGYIANILEYFMFHRGGSANGHNVVCVGHNSNGKALYMGFGTFFATPKTEAEILDKLYEDTILPPTLTGNDGFDSIITNMVKGLSENREGWDLLRHIAQTKLDAPITEINFSRRA